MRPVKLTPMRSLSRVRFLGCGSSPRAWNRKRNRPPEYRIERMIPRHLRKDRNGTENPIPRNLEGKGLDRRAKDRIGEMANDENYALRNTSHRLITNGLWNNSIAGSKRSKQYVVPADSQLLPAERLALCPLFEDNPVDTRRPIPG